LNRINQVKINAGWDRDVMTPFKGGFEDGKIELPLDDDVYNDHRAIKMVGGIAQIERKAETGGKGDAAAGAKKGAKRHGDAAIADLMAWVASRGPVMEYGYESGAEAENRDPSRPPDDDEDDQGGGGLRFGKGAW